MIVGIVLAAGASSRYGSPKATAKSKGQSFAARGVRALWSACDRVIIVLGADAVRLQHALEAEFVALAEAGALAPEAHAAQRKGSSALEVHFVTNPLWRKGMLSSAQAGLAAALALRPRAVMLLPVDHPAVRPATVLHLASLMGEALGASGRAAEKSLAYGLVPRHRQRRGHPLVISAALARAVSRDRGARDLSDSVRRHARLVGYLDVEDPGVARNLNTPLKPVTKRAAVRKAKAPARGTTARPRAARSRAR